MKTGEALVRWFYAVLNEQRPHEEIAAEMEPFLHPDVEYVSPPDAVEPGVRRGLEGFRTVLAAVTEGLGPAAQFRLGEVVERGERVLVCMSIRTGGGASGVEVTGPAVGVVWTLRDGKVRRVEWFWGLEKARAVFEGG